ncbi:MAG: hypothetical protein Q4P06_08530 [Actinomycetaceae bacterium]|nr:hypothetical protein [Actinomycetaceae bacterium]
MRFKLVFKVCNAPVLSHELRKCIVSKAILGRMCLLRLLPVLVAALALLVPFSLQPANADETVIKDPVLKVAVEEVLDGKPATAANVATLEWLEVYDEVASLEGLEDATNLEDLEVRDFTGSDLTPLRGLTNLSSLALHGEGFSDLSPLSGLTNLFSLDVWGLVFRAFPLSRG